MKKKAQRLVRLAAAARSAKVRLPPAELEPQALPDGAEAGAGAAAAAAAALSAGAGAASGTGAAVVVDVVDVVVLISAWRIQSKNDLLKRCNF